MQKLDLPHFWGAGFEDRLMIWRPNPNSARHAAVSKKMTANSDQSDSPACRISIRNFSWIKMSPRLSSM